MGSDAQRNKGNHLILFGRQQKLFLRQNIKHTPQGNGEQKDPAPPEEKYSV